jgi:hypothetical protein
MHEILVDQRAKCMLCECLHQDENNKTRVPIRSILSPSPPCLLILFLLASLSLAREGTLQPMEQVGFVDEFDGASG